MKAARRCPAPPPVTLYERDELSAVTGGALRPGGIALTGELLRLCGLEPGARVLDIGCGPGHSLALMASRFGLVPTGLDPSAAMLDRAARQAPTALLLQGTATAIPCRDGQFDGVICECVLSLTGDIDASLQEMHRVLKPGGRLIVTDIYRKKSRQQKELPDLRSCITQAMPLTAITEALDRAGFTLIMHRDHSDLLVQLAGQIIFTHGSLEQFWRLFLDAEDARRIGCALAASPLGYMALIAQRGTVHG